MPCPDPARRGIRLAELLAHEREPRFRPARRARRARRANLALAGGTRPAVVLSLVGLPRELARGTTCRSAAVARGDQRGRRTGRRVLPRAAARAPKTRADQQRAVLQRDRITEARRAPDRPQRHVVGAGRSALAR